MLCEASREGGDGALVAVNWAVGEDGMGRMQEEVRGLLTQAIGIKAPEPPKHFLRVGFCLDLKWDLDRLNG